MRATIATHAPPAEHEAIDLPAGHPAERDRSSGGEDYRDGPQ